MAYSHTTWTQLQTALSLRLEDSSQRFWTATEIPLYLTEALRTFGLISAFWRERGSIALTAGTPFYDIPSSFSASGVVDYTVTDRDIIQLTQFALLEDASSQASWLGTAMFTYQDIVNAVIKRRDQFLVDSGVVLTHSTQAVVAPTLGRVTLADTIMDVRRAAWKSSAPIVYTTLWREDERALALADPSWAGTTGTPAAYSILAPPPLELQLGPPNAAAGTLDLVTVSSGAALDPANGATVLGIPDDLTPAIKWGALADLLGNDGEARDPARAMFCEKRYQQYVMLARMMSLVVNAQVSGSSIPPCTLQDLDAGAPGWQATTGAPTDLALVGWSLAAVYPSATTTLTLDVARKAIIPTLGGDYVQVGREQLDMILDYAEHLALFKVHGQEWVATTRQANNFLLQSMTYNRRLAAAARYLVIPKEDSQREQSKRPRLIEAEGLGAAPSQAGAEQSSGGG